MEKEEAIRRKQEEDRKRQDEARKNRRAAVVFLFFILVFILAAALAYRQQSQEPQPAMEGGAWWEGETQSVSLINSHILRRMIGHDLFNNLATAISNKVLSEFEDDVVLPGPSNSIGATFIEDSFLHVSATPNANHFAFNLVLDNEQTYRVDFLALNLYTVEFLAVVIDGSAYIYYSDNSQIPLMQSWVESMGGTIVSQGRM